MQNGICVCNSNTEKNPSTGACMAKPICPTDFRPDNSSGLCIPASNQYKGCYGGKTTGGACGSKCRDGAGWCYPAYATQLPQEVWQKISDPQQYFKGEEYNNLFDYKNTINNELPDMVNTSVLYQKVSNPQQYFKGEEYNNLFSFKNTLNTLSELDFGSFCGNNGILLAVERPAGVGASYCPSLNTDGCTWVNTDTCKCTKCAAHWTLDPYFGGCTKDGITESCGPSKDPVTLVSTGSGARKKCVCPSGTDFEGEDPNDGHNGFCNSQETCPSSLDGYQLVIKKISGVRYCVCPSNSTRPDQTLINSGSDVGKCDYTSVNNAEEDCTKSDPYAYYTGSYCGCRAGYCRKTAGSNCIAMSSDSNIIGRNSNVGAGAYDICVMNNSTGGTPAVINSGNVAIQTLTSKGEDVRDYAAFHIPDIGNGHSNGEFISAIPAGGLPTGGFPAYVDVTYNLSSQLGLSPFELKSYTSFSGGSTLSTNYAFTAASNVPYSGANPPSGNNAVDNSRTVTGTMGRSARLIAHANDITQQPRMVVDTHLWTKDYKVGGEGGEGQHKHFVTTNLGSSCQMRAPAGGPILNLLNPNGHQDVNALQKNLEATIRCTKGQNVTFEKIVPGGKYDTVRHEVPSKKFWWDRGWTGGKEWVINEFQFNAGNRNFRWVPTSLWAKAFSFLGGRDSYDLNGMRITRGGEGTTLIDYCNPPRGKYHKQMYYVINGVQSEVTPKREETIEETGMYRGVQCYNPGTKILYDNDPLIQQGVMNVSAGAGGGGAIVITW